MLTLLLAAVAPLAQDPFALELRFAGGEGGFAGGPLEARVAVGEGAPVAAAELPPRPRALARLSPGAPPASLGVEVERDAAGAPAALVVRWVAAPLDPGEVRTLHVAVGARGVPSDGLAFTEDEREEDGARLAVLAFDGEPLAAWAHGHDAERRGAPAKPFHHLADPWGDGWLTEGAARRHPHHRGLFVGWSRVHVGDAHHNLWAPRAGERQAHERLEPGWLGPWSGRQVARVAWLDGAGRRLLDERRTLVAWRPARGVRAFDLTSELTAERALRLEGDPAHAGVHVRLREAWIEEQLVPAYVFPADATEHPFDGDTRRARWTAARFDADGSLALLVLLSDPADAEPPAFNARAYGRFGAFTEHACGAGESLARRHRVLLVDELVTGDLDDAALEAHWRAWAEPPVVAVERLR